MKKPTVATQILLNLFGGSLERFVAFATKPGFRGPTPERSPRPRAKFANKPIRRATPKPPSKRDMHRLHVRMARLMNP